MRPRAQTKRGVGDAAPYSNGKRECLPFKMCRRGRHTTFIIFYLNKKRLSGWAVAFLLLFLVLFV